MNTNSTTGSQANAKISAAENSPTSSNSNGPLAGVRIIDLTSVVMGPYATQMLADLGAQVIKVEAPSGDNIRHVGPMRNPGMGHMYLHAARNKHSVVLDLKHPLGKQALLDLVATSHALIFNVRPQAMARLGLSYEQVKAVKKDIIYLGCYGFGEAGSYAGKPAYDDLIQGAASVPSLSLSQGSDVPRYAPVTLGDRSVGLNAALALVAGLYYQKSTGQGQAIEVPMFECLSQFVLGDHLGGCTFEPRVPGYPDAGYARLLSPDRKPYATNDGYVCALIYNDKHWQSFFTLIDREDLKTDPMFDTHSHRADNINVVYAFVAEQMRQRSTAQWLKALEQADIPAMPLHTPDSLIQDPHLRSKGFFKTVEHPTEGTLTLMEPTTGWSKTPLSIRKLPPNLGEDSHSVLRELGYSQEHLAALIQAKVTNQ
jgi:crotonobetainyl-CoA:carnitine CoA-transferase CaiB-like acyl-CoA transferase